MITLTSSSPVEMFLGVCSNRSFSVGYIIGVYNIAGVRGFRERNIVTIKKRRSSFYYLIYPYRLKEISLACKHSRGFLLWDDN